MLGDDSVPVDVLRSRASATPQRLALVDTTDGSEWTYRALDQAVDELAAALQSAVERTDEPTRLAVALSTRPAFVVSVHAAMRLGWQLVPLNTSLAPTELAGRLDRLDPTVILCESDTEETVLDALATETAESSRRAVLSVDDAQTASVPSLPETEGSARPRPHSPGETALFLFTSGTTGDPKAVRLTPRNVLSSALASAFRLGVTPGDRWLCCLPMYHMGGLAPTFRCALYGTTLVLQREFDAGTTADVLANQDITGVSLVPTQLSRLLDADVSAPALRTILLGGAPATDALLDRADEAGLPVYPTYGLTETASQAATATPDERRAHPGTVGQPLINTAVHLINDGETVRPGERGEIVVEGPTVTPGYLNESRTSEAFSEFGFHTGDVGYRDEDGRLWVLGRLDDTIITGGELVAPAEVVEQVQVVPGVDETAVVGIDHDEWGEQVVALVAPDPNGPETTELRERILRRCRDRLADFKRPKRIRFVEAIPRTHSGTIDRERACDLARGSPGGTEHGTTR